MSHYTKIDDRSVYTAEDALEWAIATSQKHGSVSVNGVALTLEPVARFGDLEAVQAYVDRVTGHPGVINEFGRRGTVTVRKRRTGHAAHYEGYGPHGGTIAIHPERSLALMTELTVLHELAHHYALGGGHGARFAGTEIKLLGLVVGPQIALALRILFDQHDVPVA